MKRAFGLVIICLYLGIVLLSTSLVHCVDHLGKVAIDFVHDNSHCHDDHEENHAVGCGGSSSHALDEKDCIDKLLTFDSQLLVKKWTPFDESVLDDSFLKSFDLALFLFAPPDLPSTSIFQPLSSVYEPFDDIGTSQLLRINLKISFLI